MLNPKGIRLILLGPPILTIIIMAGCFNQNSKNLNLEKKEPVSCSQNKEETK